MKWRTEFNNSCANLFYNVNKHTKLFRKRRMAQRDIINLYVNTACF